METYEVFAMCIQPSQLKQTLPMCLHTPAGLAEERKNFLHWLKEQWALGWKYEDQTIAWEMYRLSVDNEWEDEDDLYVSWMGELESILEGQIRPGNYNDFGGQQ